MNDRWSRLAVASSAKRSLGVELAPTLQTDPVFNGILSVAPVSLVEHVGVFFLQTAISRPGVGICLFGMGLRPSFVHGILFGPVALNPCLLYGVPTLLALPLSLSEVGGGFALLALGADSELPNNLFHFTSFRSAQSERDLWR